MPNSTNKDDIFAHLDEAVKLGFQVEFWKTQDEIEALDYAQYWNDEEEEKKKAFYIEGDYFSLMEAYLEETGLVRQLGDCAAFIQRQLDRALDGTGVDLAAGTLWAEPHLFALGGIDMIYCVEMSVHRLLKLGPQVLAHYGVAAEQVKLCLGSFYELKLPDGSVDFVLMSAALHHADDPQRLLAEVNRVLKPGGLAITIGEHRIPGPVMAYARRALKKGFSLLPLIVQMKIFGKQLEVGRLFVKKRDLYPADPVLGDHYYFPHDYKSIFLKAGFSYHSLVDKRAVFQSFVLVKV